MKKRLIFDIDGTILEKVNFENAVIEALCRAHIPFDLRNINYFLKGMRTYEKYHQYYDIKSYYEYILWNSNLKFDISVIKDFLEHTELLVPPDTSKEVIETLDYLQDKYDLVVLTNFFESVQSERLRLRGLYDYFSAINGGDKCIKPASLAYQEAAFPYQVEDCIMIGDDYALDYFGARRAGMDAIYYNKEALENSVTEIKDFNYLRKIL